MNFSLKTVYKGLKRMCLGPKKISSKMADVKVSEEISSVVIVEDSVVSMIESNSVEKEDIIREGDDCCEVVVECDEKVVSVEKDSFVKEFADHEKVFDKDDNFVGELFRENDGKGTNEYGSFAREIVNDDCNAIIVQSFTDECIDKSFSSNRNEKIIPKDSTRDNFFIDRCSVGSREHTFSVEYVDKRKNKKKYEEV